MDLLSMLQDIQDLLSDKTGLCLVLYDCKLQEITSPSGLPKPCLQTECHNKECLNIISRKLKLVEKQSALIFTCCPKNLYLFICQTGLEKGGQKLFLVGGRTSNLNKLIESMDLITTIFNLPLTINSEKETTRPNSLKSILQIKERYNLTRQEINILSLLGAGLSNKDIASHMHISLNTVKTHVSNILRKLQLSNRTEAAVFALEKGLVETKKIFNNQRQKPFNFLA